MQNYAPTGCALPPISHPSDVFRRDLGRLELGSGWCRGLPVPAADLCHHRFFITVTFRIGRLKRPAGFRFYSA